MTDMSNPLTIGFHKAKLRADFLRPGEAEDLLDDRDAAGQYLSAVEEYVTAFNIAEAEAQRRRRSDFSPGGQQRIARARVFCAWHPTPLRLRKNAKVRTTWHAGSSTD